MPVFDCDHVWVAHEDRIGRDDYFDCFICGVTGADGYDWVNGGNRREP